jgi:hypothetical protein
MVRPQSHVRKSTDHGLTELLIVLALMAIAAIGVVSLFGDQIQELFSGKPPEAQQQTSAAAKALPAAAAKTPAPAGGAGTTQPPVAK